MQSFVWRTNSDPKKMIEVKKTWGRMDASPNRKCTGWFKKNLISSARRSQIWSLVISEIYTHPQKSKHIYLGLLQQKILIPCELPDRSVIVSIY